MSRVLCHLIPSKFVRKELLKEFNANRFWLNHYEFVDFTVFEYGQRTQYLQWRVFSILITILLTAHVFFPGIQATSPATPYSKFIYMHFWLSTLLILHSLLELIILIWTYYRTPSPILVRMHHTPWHFKLIWLMYNVLYPNILSCNVMYYAVIKDMEVHLGESRLFVALLASFAGIHVSVTAIPSRMAHILQPLLFNVLHISFTYLYQLNGFTNHLGQNYVYTEIDWLNSRTSAACCAGMWLLVTCCCHILMVCCCWYRRLVYRGKRTKSARPIYGFSPEEYYPFTEKEEHFNHFELPAPDKETAAAGEVPEAMAEESPHLKAPRHYSPHMSYRLVPVPRSMVTDSSVDVRPDASDLLIPPSRVSVRKVGRLRKGFKKARSSISYKDSEDVGGCPKTRQESSGVARGTTRYPPRMRRRADSKKKQSLVRSTTRDRGRKRQKCSDWKSLHKAKANSVTCTNSVIDLSVEDAFEIIPEGSGKLQMQAHEGFEENTSPMDITSEVEAQGSPSSRFYSDEYIDYLSESMSSQWEHLSIVHECVEDVHRSFSSAE
ncbi:unnamed protein product [Candidula unifasciata]|uniref:Uncharacterized protein n=1 Tax=Candidula unifasciata TaxID=100452 RepID=A0A8S3Z425_9EUPU|nr:unnamed protein product [Candidula unifasciata]